MSEFPGNWEYKCIGEFASRVRRKNSSGECQDVMTISAVDGLVSQRDYFNKIVASKNTEGYTLLHRNDFAYNKSYSVGYPVGAVRRLKTKGKGIVSPLYICFELDEDCLELQFADYLFDSDWFVQAIYGIAKEGARSHGLLNIGIEEFFSASLPIPPLPEQKKIAEILSGIDSCIALAELQKKKNEQTLETISAEVFGRLTASDPARQLSEVCALITKGATPTTFGHKLHGTAFQGSVTFLGGGSTSETGKFDLHPARHCTQDAVDTLKRSQLAEGDTLVTIVGASIGNTCQIPRSILPANINQNVALVRSDEAALDKNFLNLFLRTEGRRILVNIATTQAQPSVSLAQVGQLQIPIPNLDEQRRIASAIEGIRESISLLDEKICKSKYFKIALSGDLLSGRKRVSV